MNEIINRLNEIEEKADAIISDAKSRRERRMQQLEADKKKIDAEFEQDEQRAAQELKEKLIREGEEHIRRSAEKNRKAILKFEEAFAEKKEEVAEMIFRQIVQ